VERSRVELRRSNWFKRGWTLQELLAPQFLECYDKNWVSFGDRNSLRVDISAVTRISETHLRQPHNACVAVKMS
jgi:hypothetical protein